MFKQLACLLLATVSGTAHADWQRATTDHFVVYADDTPQKVAEKARELEIFDATLKTSFGLPIRKAADPNPVTLYLVRDIDAVQRIYGAVGSGVAGFYMPTPGGAVAFMPQGSSGGEELSPRLILFHEYGHHFLLGNFAQAFPSWFSEGFAEFVATFELTPEGAALGRPAAHRADMLRAVQDEPVADLFRPGPQNVAAVYGQGWLLTHYFMANPERRPLLDKYFRNIHSGMRDPQAARDAFGDLGKLGVEIRTYMRSRRFSGFRVAPDRLPKVEPRVTGLTTGEAAFIPLRMASQRGVDEAKAKVLYARAAPVAARFPDDPVVQGWFAEIAHDAKQYDAADAAADRALARDPGQLQALIYRGRNALARAEALSAGDAGRTRYFDDARRWLLRANKVSSDTAEPLHLYYQTFEKEGRPMTANAIAALYRAAELLPQNSELRIAAMRRHFLEGEVTEGKQMLATLTFNVHQSRDNPINALSASLDKGTPPKEAIAAYDKDVAERRAKAEAKRKS